jgi:hypothetical protein
MGAFTFNIISGQPPFTAGLTPMVVPDKSGLSLGYNFFTGVTEGTYILTITDALGCIYTINLNLLYLACSDTDIFKYAISSIVVGNEMIIGERALNPKIIKFHDADDLDLYLSTTVVDVGSITAGLESVCYSSLTGMLYFGARDVLTGYLAIIETDPTTLAYTKHVISPILGDSAIIATDNIYIYGSNNEMFFKIRISDWSIIQTYTFTGFDAGTAIALNIDRSEFYISSVTELLAIVSTADVSSYVTVDISIYVSNASDDLCYYDNKVYVAGRNPIINYGAVSVNVDTLVATGIDLLPSNGLWNYCTKVYSASSDEKIEVFDVSNPALITTYTFDEAGFIPSEIMFVGERTFVANWGDVGVAKLCEYMCLPIDCTTTTTTSTSSTTTTSTTIAPTTTTSTTIIVPTTTTTTSIPPTTTTTTTCYNLVEYPCGMYNIYNYTDEYRDIVTRDCYTEVWFTGISIGPHSVYKLAECKELRVTDCELEVEEVFICVTTTTTSTTACPCDDSELIVTASETYNAIANTYGTYCTESGKRYNCQTFDLGGSAYIKRVGILGGKPIGSPNITMQCLILDTHLYGGRGSDCGDVPSCPYVTPAAFPFNVLAYSSNTVTFTNNNPTEPQWYYFCFDDYAYIPADHTNGDYPAGSPPSVAFVFTVNGVNGNTASNYVQFCTDSNTYANGHYAYKINDLFSCAWGEPLVNYDLSCRICYEMIEAATTTTTTTTIVPTTTTTTTEECTPEGPQISLLYRIVYEGTTYNFLEMTIEQVSDILNYYCCPYEGGGSFTNRTAHSLSISEGSKVYSTLNYPCEYVEDGTYVLNELTSWCVSGSATVFSVVNGTITELIIYDINCTTTTTTIP